MSFTASQQATLKAYITNDPDALGFTPYVAAGDGNDIAAILNFVRDGVAACPVNNVVGAAITVNRNDVAPTEIIQCIAAADFSGATQIQISKLEMLFVMGTLDCTKTNVSANLQSIFSAASAATKNALAAVVQRHGTALEKEIGQDGVSISGDDVLAILRS